jgi:hypothetical protein
LSFPMIFNQKDWSRWIPHAQYSHLSLEMAGNED